MTSNKTIMRLTEICADCGSLDPAWALVNRGLLVCDECCSVHRSLGRHISQVKSLKKSHWSPSQLAMVNSLNSGGVNSLWEHSLTDLKKRKPTPKDPVHPVKAEFIKVKHQQLGFVPRSSEESEEELSQALHSSVRTGNLETSLRLLAQGADPNYHHPDKGSRALHVAAKAGQMAQVELLLAHGALPIARDSQRNTPAQCARCSGHREVSARLCEVVYEVTDRLTYFLSKQRAEHCQGVHLILPRAADCLVSPVHPPHSTNTQLSQLTNSQFEDLAMDVYDEVDRRETESIWGQSAASLEYCSVPFLPVNPGLSTMRNQGRQKLATCSRPEFSALVLDILTEAKRRHTANERLVGNKGNQKESDEEPLYDSVASDEDYASAEHLAILVAQNAKGLPLNVSEVSNSESQELKERLAASEARASQLYIQIRLLNTMIDEVKQENEELKVTLKQSVVSINTLESETSDRDFPPSDVRAQRPVSMYEARDTIQQAGGRMPENEEVMKRTGELTRSLRDLWGPMKPPRPNHHRAAADNIRLAVSKLSAIFPQKHNDKVVAEALRQLSTSTVKLQAYCSELEKSADHVRTAALAVAEANKDIITRFQ